MRKKDELSKSQTCMAHAHPEEMVFVLLGRDAAAPFAIRAWVAERLRLGKNAETDEQIVEALACAQTMEVEGRQWAEVPNIGRPNAEMLAEALRALGAHNAELLAEISELRAKPTSAPTSAMMTEVLIALLMDLRRDNAHLQEALADARVENAVFKARAELRSV